MVNARTGRLDRIADRALVAAMEALFPPNTVGAPDHQQARVAERLRAYLQEVPASHRRLVTLLFVFVEWAPPWVALYPRRYSKLSLASRQRLIRRWRGSALYPLRMVGDALKGLGTMIYCSHPDVLRYMGMYTVSPRDWDPLTVEARPDALVMLGRARATGSDEAARMGAPPTASVPEPSRPPAPAATTEASS
jgi:hypothetical protein